MQHQQGNVMEILTASVLNMHAPIKPDECPPLNNEKEDDEDEGSSKAERRRKELRRTCGMCVCGPRGAKIILLKDRLLRSSKAFCPPHRSAERALSRDGFHIFALAGVPYRRHAGIVDGKVEVETPLQSYWLHAGLLFLKPIRHTFLDLTLLHSEGSSDVPCSAREMRSPSTPSTRTRMRSPTDSAWSGGSRSCERCSRPSLPCAVREQKAPYSTIDLTTAVCVDPTATAATQVLSASAVQARMLWWVLPQAEFG